MDKENLKATIEIKREDFLIPLDKALIECSNAVHVGLSGLDKLDELPETLSGEDNFYHFKPFGEILLEDRKKLFKSWLLKKSFEDLIKAVTLMLIDIDRVLYINTKLKNTAIKSREELNAIFSTPDYQPSRKDFPDLLKTIKPYLTDNLNLENEILSINRVRRCLVHRNGIVSKIDFYEGETSLKLKWNFLRYFFIKDNEEIEMKPPIVIIEGPAIPEIRIEKKEKEYKLNERIDFDFVHFNELIFTCKSFGVDLIEKLTFKRTDKK